MHTEEGMETFLENLYKIQEFRYYGGDFDSSVWLLDFDKALEESGLSKREREVIHYLYFIGYSQIELAKKLGCKKNTVNTLKSRAIKKLAEYYEMMRLMEEGDSDNGQ
jgi:DNA-directed RNA polymerase specialized sigma24 family protein